MVSNIKAVPHRMAESRNGQGGTQSGLFPSFVIVGSAESVATTIREGDAWRPGGRLLEKYYLRLIAMYKSPRIASKRLAPNTA